MINEIDFAEELMSEYNNRQTSEHERFARQSARLRGDLLPPKYEKFAETIDIAVEGGVQLLAEAYGMSSERIRRQAGMCYPTSIVSCAILREVGVNATFRGAGQNRNGMTHAFLEAKYKGETIWLDGTWQQFLPSYGRPDKVPKTLIAPAGDMSIILDRLSINSDLRPIWVNSRPQKIDLHTYPQVLRQLFDERGWDQKTIS